MVIETKRSAVSKDGGCPFFVPCELQKIPSIYSSIFDIFDINACAGSFSLFCRNIFYILFML